MTVYLHPEETTISQFYAKPTFELLDVNKQKHPVVCLSALPSKTEDMEITSCHLRVVCHLSTKHNTRQNHHLVIRAILHS